MCESFRDCVWYNNSFRAVNRARRMARTSGDSFVIVQDLKTRMFGLARGDAKPDWCGEAKGFRHLVTIRPTSH